MSTPNILELGGRPTCSLNTGLQLGPARKNLAVGTDLLTKISVGS